MSITSPIPDASAVSVPDMLRAFAGARLQAQQGALLGQQAGLVGQQAQQAAVATKLAQARLPIVLNALHSFEEPSSGAGVTPGGIPRPAAPAPGGNMGLFTGTQAGSDTSGAQATGPATGVGLLRGPLGAMLLSSSGIASPGAAPAAGPAPAGSGNSTSNSQSSGSPAAIDAALRQQFFVNPAGTPNEVRRLVVAGLSGDPGLLAAAKYQRQLGVQQRLAQSRYESSNMYDALTAVLDAPAGRALATLQAVAPVAARQIDARAQNAAQADAMARQFSSEIAAQVHQYTGRKVDVNKVGEYRDSLTGLPVPGVTKMGMSSQQLAMLAAKGLEPVSIPQSNGTTVTVPRWQAPGSGAQSLEDWVHEVARRAGVPGVQPTISGAPRVASSLAITSAVKQAAQQHARQNGGVAPPIANVHPQLVKALSDPTYRMPQTAPQFGVTATPEFLAQQQITAKSRATLMQDSQLATRTAAQALTYLTAAQRIMQSKGSAPVVGMAGPIYNEITRVFGGVNSTNYQQVGKYLSNAALQYARSNYPANMSTAEVQLQLHEMSPHVTQTPAAINALINENIRASQYAINSARRVLPYLSKGNNPQAFAQWNQKYWPQQKIVNQQPTQGAGATPNAGAAAGAAPPAAVSFLLTHPQLAGAFQAKYGYLPQGVGHGG